MVKNYKNYYYYKEEDLMYTCDNIASYVIITVSMQDTRNYFIVTFLFITKLSNSLNGKFSVGPI